LAANAGDAPTASDKQIDVNIVFINKLSYLPNTPLWRLDCTDRQNVEISVMLLPKAPTNMTSPTLRPAPPAGDPFLNFTRKAASARAACFSFSRYL
jgi:hypothetical protein